VNNLDAGMLNAVDSGCNPESWSIARTLGNDDREDIRAANGMLNQGIFAVNDFTRSGLSCS
jgi:hypothetical protein